MRTRAKGNYCLTAIALGANVRIDAHFFIKKLKINSKENQDARSTHKAGRTP